MCGISGLFRLDGADWDEKGARNLQAMMARLGHRGPDSSGTFIGGPVALGVNRLSVVDPARRSDQPMQSADGRYVVAFNGEIYNFRQLREQLSKEGLSFATTSDTEVLLALYMQKGRECLHMLRGMFAFAIWDRQREALFVARDRLGEKPFYYFQDGNLFAFASELPALLALAEVPRKVDWAGIHQAMYFMHAVAPYTAFENILKLPPAHSMVITRRESCLSRYWQCRFTGERFTDLEECAGEVGRCLDETVSLMCQCDVPVGALLSGGLDSSAVVASMRRSLQDFPTFRISSSDCPDLEELRSAQQVSRHFGTRHHEYEIGREALRLLQNVVENHGEPIASPVPIDAFLLAQRMTEHVTVALCGAGGDELFGGYREHRILRMLDGYFSGWRALEGEGKDIRLSDHPDERMAWDLYQRIGREKPQRIFPSLKYHREWIFQKIYSQRMQDAIAAADPIDLCDEEFIRCGTESLFDGFIGQQLLCASQYSTAEINDRAGMSSSLEIRSPFLDVKMIELALKIPPAFKVPPGGQTENGKFILRKAMENRLPSLPLACRKIGFGGTTPYKSWLDSSAYFEEKLKSPALADSGMFNMEGIRELFLLYQCGADIAGDIFFGLASTALWLETFF
jgi:asparagine synthase (glutamine-hydrolysing)